MKRWRWLGHVLRMPKKRLPNIALKWTPPGNEREEDHWEHGGEIEEEVKATGKTWHELKGLAKDRVEWLRFVAALYSPGSDEG